MSYRDIAGAITLAFVGLVVLVVVIIAIRIVTLDTPAATPRNSNDATYEVVDGDSLAGISEQTGVPVSQIEDLNPRIDPLALVPGQRLRLRPRTAREKRRAAERRARMPRYYVVKRGDALLAIAAKTKVDMFRIRQLNKKKDLDVLYPGMRLKLRPDPRKRRAR